jgi:2-hydroxyacyl-CoA lyase 1
MRAFIDTSKIQFLATPMGKGVVSDYHELSAARARTYVLGNADVIFLCGARLNWILHFGLPPRFRKDVKIIQLDNDPFEIHTNVNAAVPMCADAKVALSQMIEAWPKTTSTPSPDRSIWTKTIAEKSAKNAAEANEFFADKSVPMNYYTSQGIVQDEIAKLGNDYIIVAEGSNSMDIGRTVLMNN